MNPDSVRFLSSFIVTVGSNTDSVISSVTYTAANFAAASVTNEVQTAGTPNKFTFTIQLTNAIPSGGKLVIVWPSEVEFQNSDATSFTTITIYGVVQSSSTYTATAVQNTQAITITGTMFDSGIAVQSDNIVIEVDDFHNPESQISSSSFSITTQNSNSENIDRRSTGLTVASTEPGTITVSSLTYRSNTVDSEFTVLFIEATDLSPTGATLRIYWPSEVSYVTSGTLTCSLTVGFSANTPPCVVTESSGYMELEFYQGTNHFYTIGTFKNPLGAMTQSSWQIQVFDSNGDKIMEQLTGIVATSVVDDITVSVSTRPSGSTTVALRTDYTLTFTPSSRLLSDSTILFYLPFDQITFDGTTSCLNGASSLSCTFTNTNSTHFETEITQWCNAGAE